MTKAPPGHASLNTFSAGGGAMLGWPIIFYTKRGKEGVFANNSSNSASTISRETKDVLLFLVGLPVDVEPGCW